MVSNDSTLNGGVSLIGGVSRLVGHCYLMLFDSMNPSPLTTPWALSFTVVLQLISLPLKSKLLFQTCSNYVALYNLIAKFKTKLPTFHRVGPSEGMCICGTAVWLIVSLHNDEINWDKIAFKLLKWILLVAGCCRSASERPMNNLAPLESKQWCNYTSRSSRRLWVSNPV